MKLSLYLCIYLFDIYLSIYLSNYLSIYVSISFLSFAFFFSLSFLSTHPWNRQIIIYLQLWSIEYLRIFSIFDFFFMANLGATCQHLPPGYIWWRRLIPCLGGETRGRCETTSRQISLWQFAGEGNVLVPFVGKIREKRERGSGERKLCL